MDRNPVYTFTVLIVMGIIIVLMVVVGAIADILQTLESATNAGRLRRESGQNNKHQQERGRVTKFCWDVAANPAMNGGGFLADEFCKFNKFLLSVYFPTIRRWPTLWMLCMGIHCVGISFL